MSSRRSILWLIFFILLILGAHVLVSSRIGARVQSTHGTALVPQADHATLIELVRPRAESVVLTRSADWRMIAPYSAAVEREVLLRMLDGLAFSPVSDVLTIAEMRRIGRTPADFGLTEPVLRLSVRNELKETAVLFGAATPTGEGIYAECPQTQTICVVPTNLFAVLDQTVDSLRRRSLLTLEADRVRSIDVRRAGGKFVRVWRTDDGSWRMSEPQETTASSMRINALLGELTQTRAARFVWPAATEDRATPTPALSLLAGYGLDSESAVTVTLKDAGGSSSYVSFGKEADEAMVYALVQDGGAVVTVCKTLRDRLLAEADSFADLRLFPCESASVNTLSISDGELVYLLARGPEGEWRLDSPVSAPADQDAVNSLVQGILSLRTTERDPHGLLVSVSTNLEPIAVSRDAILVQNRLEDLRSKTVLKLPSDKIRRLSVTGPDGAQESAVWDSANRTWILGKPDGADLNGLALTHVLAALDPLLAVSVVRLRIAASEAGNYGLEHPRYTIAVDPLAEGAVRRNILIGANAPGGGSYATVGSTDAVFILSAETVRALTDSFTIAQ